MTRTNSNGTQRKTSRRLSKKQLHKRKIRRILAVLTVLTIIAIIAGINFQKFYSSHFNKGTIINNIDCSWITPEQAYEKLNEGLGEKVITFVFTDNLFTFTGSSFDLHVGSIDELEKFLVDQKSGNGELDFVLYTSLNEDKLLDNMKSIPNLDSANMHYPENAYITFSEEDNELHIVPELIGNYIDFDEAFDLAYEGLVSGYTSVDFASITTSAPQISSEDLNVITDSINNILNTTITFNITNDFSLTLDKSVMKDWLTVDETGNYNIDIESNLPTFVDLLAEKSSGATVNFEFPATDFGTVTVPAKNLSINKESEIELIKSELGTAEVYTHTPAYNIDFGNTYVEIDIARQHVWMYKDGECILSTDTVTGNAGNHDTPPGYFFLTGKTTNRVLRGYNDNGTPYASPVDYWMPFNGGIGLHDASWRSSFGGTIYKGNGSHGCVNLPRSSAKTIYENIDFSTPIIVYSSN